MGFRRRKLNKRIVGGHTLRKDADAESMDLDGGATGLEQHMAARQMNRKNGIEQQSRHALAVMAFVGVLLLLGMYALIRAIDG